MMKLINYCLLIFFVLLLQQTLQGQSIVLNESFDSGIPGSWKRVDADGNTPANSIFDMAWISYENLNESGDSVAASTSYYNPAGTAEDYLITPALSMGNFGNIFTWKARSLDASFPDGYDVLVSTTDRNINSFTDTIYSTPEALYYWDSLSINLENEGYVNQTIYLAFVNNTEDGNVLLVNDVRVTTNDASNIEKNKTTDLIVYPNPVAAHEMLNIDGVEKAIEQVTIFDATGRIVQKAAQLEDNRIRLRNNLHGVHILQIHTDNQIIRKKIVIR